MSNINFTETKSEELIEILGAISVCHALEQLISDHINGELEIENIDELANKYHAGGLSLAIKHLTNLAGLHAAWLSENSTDKQA